MQLTNLFADLVDDIGNPAILWQAGTILVCAAAGWGVARLVRGAWMGRSGGEASVFRVGVESFARVLSPLLMVGLLMLARHFLSRYGNVNLLRLAIPLFASFAVIRIAFYLLRRTFARRGPVGAAILTFEKIFALLVWLAVALYITGLWPGVFEFLDATKLPLGRHPVSLATIMQAVVSVVVLLMMALWAGAALEERLMGMEGLHTSLRVVMARMSRAVLILVAVLASLSLVGIDLTVLSVFGGALGVGLGLGLQKIASNYVSGFVVLIERSLSIGDTISVDKYSGKVSSINARYTVLQGLDGVRTVLPNEMLISIPVQNQSLSNRTIRAAIALKLAHGSDLDAVFGLLEPLPVGVARVMAEPVPDVLLKKFTGEGYEVELGFWIGEPELGTDGVVSAVNKKIYAFVQSGQIKLAQATNNAALAAGIS